MPPYVFSVGPANIEAKSGNVRPVLVPHYRIHVAGRVLHTIDEGHLTYNHDRGSFLQ